MAAAEVYSPTAAAAAQQQQRGKAASQAWRAVVGWIGFLLQVLLQILRGTPSCAQLLSFVGFRYPLLSGPTASEPSPEVAFMPLRSEIPADVAPAPEAPPEPLGRLTVVLDLDETLVSAYESSSLPAIVRTQAVEAGLHCFDMECISSDKDVEGKQKVNHVTVFERPGLHEFLQKTSEFADLILFTAGLEGYARPLVDRIDVHNRFRLRLYRPSTVTTEYREHVKDLSCVSKDFCRIVIVDNNPFSFILQPLNGIPCVPFSAGQHSDDQVTGDEHRSFSGSELQLSKTNSNPGANPRGKCNKASVEHCSSRHTTPTEHANGTCKMTSRRETVQNAVCLRRCK